MVSESQIWTKKMTALIYGAVIGITVVLFIEATLIVLIGSAIIGTVIIAPVIEEFFKTQAVHFSSKYTRTYVVGYVALSAFGFGLAELFVRSIFSGEYIISFTPFLHVLFSLPAAYAYKISPKAYPAGLMASIMFHATWNFSITFL